MTAAAEVVAEAEAEADAEAVALAVDFGEAADVLPLSTAADTPAMSPRTQQHADADTRAFPGPALLLERAARCCS